MNYLPTRKGWNSNRRNHNTSGENHRKCPECGNVIVNAFAKEGMLRADACTKCNYVKIASMSKVPQAPNTPGVQEDREVELSELSRTRNIEVANEFPFLRPRKGGWATIEEITEAVNSFS